MGLPNKIVNGRDIAQKRVLQTFLVKIIRMMVENPIHIERDTIFFIIIYVTSYGITIFGTWVFLKRLLFWMHAKRRKKENNEIQKNRWWQMKV